MSFSEPNPSGEEIREIAELRWKSCEAFLWDQYLTPTAARLGGLLIAAMNSKTRECFPSEARLAAQMGVDRRALQRAKVELKKRNLIDWGTPYGPRGGAYYSFNFEELMNVWERGKMRGDLAVEEQIKENLVSRYTSPKRKERLRATQKLPVPDALPAEKVSPKAVEFTAIENRHDDVTVTPMAVDSDIHSGKFDIQSGIFNRLYSGKIYRQTCPFIAPIRHDPLDHDLGFTEVGVNDTPLIAPSKPKVPERPLKRCRYPRLIENFSTDERTANLIMALDLVIQDKADKLRATRGTQFAAKFLEGHGIPIKQPEVAAA